MPGSGDGAVVDSLCAFIKEERGLDRQTTIIPGKTFSQEFFFL